MIQLTFHLHTDPVYSLDNLVYHPGVEGAVQALQLLVQTDNVPAGPVLLHGPAGTGKTHILQAFTAFVRMSRPHASCKALCCTVTGQAPDQDVLATLESCFTGDDPLPKAVTLDDIHLLSSSLTPLAQGLFDKTARHRMLLLLSSEIPASDLFTADAHLHSRLLSGLVLPLEPPDDAARVLIVDKLARDRNLRVSHEVCRYLVTHKSRNIKDLEELLHILDTESLRLKRRVTIPLIRLLEKDGVI